MLQGRGFGAEKSWGKTMGEKNEQNLEESYVGVPRLDVQTWTFTPVGPSASPLSRALGEIPRTTVAIIPFFIQRRPCLTHSPAQITPSNRAADYCLPKSSPSLGLHVSVFE